MVVDFQKEHEALETQLCSDMLMMNLASGGERTEKDWAKLFSAAGFTSYKITPDYLLLNNMVGNFNPNPENSSRTRPVWGGSGMPFFGFGAGLGQLKPAPAGSGAGYGSCLEPGPLDPTPAPVQPRLFFIVYY
ncbi:Chavicol O-methyltransferase [Sesamum angolense]|uniref:Chavicol O-methyltransferase n=1 Tax=Sesamum angolense TaxID=2727404 RepID=A0AAE2BUD5_9LAMI|nr:Chavicol O-methyltransferase [Sesamum angolense]